MEEPVLISHSGPSFTQVVKVCCPGGAPGPRKATGSGTVEAKQNENGPYLPPCICWAVIGQREGETIPLSGESRADLGLELAHPKTSRRTKTRRVTSRALGEGKCKGNIIPTPKMGNKPTQRSCSFRSQGVEKVIGFLADIMGRRGKETTFSHCCTTCLEIKPSEQKADPVLLLNKSGLFPALELVLHRLQWPTGVRGRRELPSWAGGGGSRPGPAGQTWGRSSPLGCPRSLPPAFSVFPPADFLLSAPFQSLGWGQHTTPQKGHYKELSGGPQACLSTFKRIRETTKGVMFSFVCQRPAARQEGHTALGLRRLIIQCVFYFKAKPSVLP